MPEVESKVLAVIDATKGKGRGRYNVNASGGANDKAEAAKMNVSNNDKLSINFVYTTNGYGVKDSWKDCSGFACFGIVPSYWHKHFTNDTSLSQACKNQSRVLGIINDVWKLSKQHYISNIRRVILQSKFYTLHTFFLPKKALFKSS